MNKCKDCGADMIPGATSIGWCKDECDLKPKFESTGAIHHHLRACSAAVREGEIMREVWTILNERTDELNATVEDLLSQYTADGS